MKRKKPPTLREYSSDLLGKVHGLHFRLEQLVPIAEKAMEAMPVGPERDAAAFAIVSAISALKEHKP